MKRIHLIMLLSLILAGYANFSEAAGRSYRVSLTIPEIIGVNYFPEEELVASPAIFTQDKQEQVDHTITTEEVMRNNQLVLLNTIVVK